MHAAVLLNVSNLLQKGIKCLASLAFYRFSSTCLIDLIIHERSGLDPGFLERGFICIKVWGLPFLILSNYS